MKSCPAKTGDYFEFFAEIDLLCALSTCPGGDLSVPLWGEGSEKELVCHPLGIEIYEVDKDFLKDWKSPKVSNYSGNHGMKF